VPIIGRELLSYDPDTYAPEGIQSVIGVGFRSKWRGTESELLMWEGTTPTGLRGTGVSSNVAGLAPIMTGTSSTGLTNAASAPATAATIAVGSANPYAYLG